MTYQKKDGAPELTPEAEEQVAEEQQERQSNRRSSSGRSPQTVNEQSATPQTLTIPTQSQTVTNRLRTNDKIFVRTTPGGPIITVVATGTVGTKVSERTTFANGYEWVEVRFDNGATGYVAKTFTDQLTTTISTPTVSANRLRTTDRLFLRTTPGGAIVTVLDTNTTVTNLSTTPITQGGYSWIRVQAADGTTGYVAREFTTPETTTGLSETQRAAVLQQIQLLLQQIQVLQVQLQALRANN